MLVSSFNLSQSFTYTPYLFYKKRFKSEINSFYIWTLLLYSVVSSAALTLFCTMVWFIYVEFFLKPGGVN
jgi:hypothetical protein